MVKASVVIGANYGDEGKGLMTDYLARLHNADLVVRFNGGAQAGHTVVTADGRRHVFSHFGSGTFTGARTYLSRFFIVNPMQFKTEWDELYELIPCFDNPPCVDHNCIVTTPWDILYNQVDERLRRSDRHGSCGMGVYQTIHRNNYFYPRITVTSLSANAPAGAPSLFHVLNSIRCYYIERLAALEKKYRDKESLSIISDTKKLMENHKIFTHFFEDCLFFTDHTQLYSCFPHSKYIIFEGSQGLGLDQCMGVYPHVTPSNTGIRNVKLLQQEWGFTIEETVYVTRSYFTRHGAGPLEGEEPWPVVSPDTVVDNTNVENEWQGRIRYAPMNWTTLRERIYRDRMSNNITDPYKLAVTHCDYPYGRDSCERYNSYGPTAEDVRKHD